MAAMPFLCNAQLFVYVNIMSSNMIDQNKKIKKEKKKKGIKVN